MLDQMKIDIKGFLESSFLDWPGQISAVIFLAGCNFRCPFCHNHGLVLRPHDYQTIDWNSIKARLSKFRGWIDGVVISGGEPTLSPDLPELIKEIRMAGFKVKLDTNGSRPNLLSRLIDQGMLDHVAMDVKSALYEIPYARAAGKPGFLEKVKQSLALLRNSGVEYTLRTTVVPDLHTEKDIMELAGQLRGVKDWRLQNFKPENALDSGYRGREPMNQSFFEALDHKAHQVLYQTA